MTKGVLVYLIRGSHVLLAMKKRGFGQGKWNGPGGKIEFGENALHAAVRETQEEIGTRPVLEHPIGTILYHDERYGNWHVTVFRTEEFSGDILETEEMKPQWFRMDELPYEEMWAGDKEWLPFVLMNRHFEGEIWFDRFNNISKKDIKEVRG